MSEYFFSYIDKIPKAMQSSLFTVQHLLAIGMIICLWVILILLLKDGSMDAKWKYMLYASLFLPVLEVAQILWYIKIGQFSFAYTLPLHLCSLMSIILPIMVLTRNKLLMEYSYAIGFAPALLTLITPDVYYYPAFSFIYIQTMLVHGIICFIPVFMICAMGFRPDLRNLPKVVAMLVVFAIIIIPINHITGGNYFFLRYPAEGSPMEVFENMVGSPWYLIPTLLLGCVLWVIMYLPFYLVKYKAGRRELDKLKCMEDNQECKPVLK